MPNSNRFARIGLLLLLAAGLLSAAAIPRPAPPLRMKGQDGNVSSLWGLRGKVVVVMFFSTNCSHCHDAAKIIIPLYDGLHPRGLEILGLATNSKASENLGRFIEDFHVKFPMAVASRVDWARLGAFHMNSKPPYVPHLLFVDRGGMIRAEFTGSDREFFNDLENRFRAVAESLLNEPPGAEPVAKPATE